MRFRGTPGLHVIDSTTGTEIGKFDAKGFLEIDDNRLAERMKRSFLPAPIRQKKAATPKKEVNNNDG